jgi:beta-lactamase regulating signal transducer with metallopeptidase domain
VIQVLVNHLWQSTLFSVAVGLLTLAFRENGANIRFCLWLVASVKFLLPFHLLVLVGTYLDWGTAPGIHTPHLFVPAIDQIAQLGTMMTNGVVAPSQPAASAHWSISTFIWVIWSIGFALLISRWVFQWWKIRAAVKSSSLLDIEAPISVRATRTILEPSIFGIVRPVLLLPEGISTRLTPEQLKVILAHELCHWRRRDNLTAAAHLLVEALFWFHPLVWWLGTRLVAERERSCDEAVIRSGGDRRVYAEGILKVCRFYVEPPLPCIVGISGGTLSKRIEAIMTGRGLVRLHFTKKILLAVAGCLAIAGPIAAGFAIGPTALAQVQQRVAQTGEVDMKHYQSSEWNFGIDIPVRWNAFPAVPTNSPNEIIRFASHESGVHLLIVFRAPYDPSDSPKAYADKIQQVLAKNGFSNFVTGETNIGSRPVVTLDFNKQIDGRTWSCRHYIIVDGTLVYTLGFGTNKRDAMFDLYDRMAKSFTFE